MHGHQHSEGDEKLEKNNAVAVREDFLWRTPTPIAELEKSDSRFADVWCCRAERGL